MPLVIFNYDFSTEGISILNKLERTLTIPEEARNARWSLRAVNALYIDKYQEDFTHLEIDFPELLNAQNVIYSTKTVGNVEAPPRTLRFYPSNYQVSEKIVAGQDSFRENSCFKCVSEYPNWDLGEHQLYNNKLNIVVSARVGNVSTGTFTRLNSFSVILSYE